MCICTMLYRFQIRNVNQVLQVCVTSNAVANKYYELVKRMKWALPLTGILTRRMSAIAHPAFI